MGLLNTFFYYLINPKESPPLVHPSSSLGLPTVLNTYLLCFNALVFVMFSCLFPTGFAMSLSVILFMLGLYIFLVQNSAARIRLLTYEKFGLALFAWLAISCFWSEGTVGANANALLEYRFYIMLPVISVAYVFVAKRCSSTIILAVVGGGIALTASYLLGFQFITIEGASRSLANRIYHGFIISCWVLICYAVAVYGMDHKAKVLLVLLCIAGVINVLFIEDGRTGYLQVIGISILISMLSLRRSYAVLAICAATLLLFLTLQFPNTFSERIWSTTGHLMRILSGAEPAAENVARLEWYIAAARIGLSNWLIGFGVGDVSNTLLAAHEQGLFQLRTDNIHNEFLNMFLAGGLPAVLLYVAFLSSVALEGVKMLNRNKSLCVFFLGIAIIVGIGSMFNSIIKDFGEKHAILVLLALGGSVLRIYNRDGRVV